METARFTAVDRVHHNPSGTNNPSVLTNKLNCSDASTFEGYTQTDVFPRNASIRGVHNASIGKIKSRSAFDWKQFLLLTTDDPYLLVVSDCDVAKACTALAVIVLRQHQCWPPLSVDFTSFGTSTSAGGRIKKSTSAPAKTST
nr:hypothetical protein [Caballeronia sp. SBC2]